MAWPCRYYETFSYRSLVKDYFRRGARWTSAPKPQLTDALFDLERWGFEPVPCDMLHYAPFGGSFHCATLDIRRRGALDSYSPRSARATAP